MIDLIIRFFYIGAVNGAMLALLSLGFSLVYGVGKILNLAHGAFFILTGYIVYSFIPIFGSNIWLSAIFSLLIITIIGGVVYLILIKPLQDSELSVVLITFALAFFFEQLIRVVWGAKYKSIYQLIIFHGSTKVFGVAMINQLLFLIIASIILVSIFMIFISKSKLGKSIRAISQDPEAAQLMGINANKILLYTMMISAFLAGVAAILYLPSQNLDPVQGWDVLTNAFAVVILGGMGSLFGSIVGAYILGFANSFTSIFIPNGPSWAHVVPIILIIIMLLIRPRGLFGKKEVK
ncbi:MAG: branched-chain amino acid ABC transporter permease [Promethearchaeota archaeon]